MRKRRWLWVLLFIWMFVLLVSLAAGWNVSLVQDYWRMLEMAKSASGTASGLPQLPAMRILAGWLGFTAALATIVLFFAKILKEMRLNQLQSEFLAMVSHELKTPIASIELSSSLIRGGGLSGQEVARLWSSHDAELKRLREEVDALLEAASLEAKGADRRRRKHVVLEQWLGESLERWRKILGPGASLVREGEPLDTHARVDLRTLNLIADNLVDNARKFSRGKPELHVRTRKLPKRGWFGAGRWQIEFSDRGWGFDPNDSRRIFSRFVRARTDAPYSIPGSGLGLYLAESASRALGLTLSGHSEGKGQGARFTLEGREWRA